MKAYKYPCTKLLLEVESAVASEVIEVLLSGVTDDIRNTYRNLLEAELRNSFYWVIHSSNPKFYPISGFQHFLGSGFVAARLASFLGFRDDYDVVVAFLGGVLHDFNKWYVSLEQIKRGVFERLRYTSLFNSISNVLGEKRAERAFFDAAEIALKLESGGVPRGLQRVAEVVRVADILTGSRESWSISYCISTILSMPGIEAKHVLPVVIGKQRPVVSIVSEFIEEELEKRGAVPLVSTPEGMIFLVKNGIDVGEVYEAIADQIVSAEEGRSEGREASKGAERVIRIEPMARFLSGGTKSLAGLSRAYRSIANYSPEDVENSYEHYRASAIEDLRVFIVVLANIYRKPVERGEKDEERLRRFVEVLQLSEEQAERVRRGRDIDSMLRELYNVLRGIGNREVVTEIARRAKDFVISEMRRLGRGDVSLLVKKLATYIGIGYTSYATADSISDTSGKVCGICREPVVKEKSLTVFLQTLNKNVIRARMSTAEVFHPDIQGKPEKEGSIEGAKGYPVCELCYFEAEVAPRRIKYMDGLWAAVLQYYPAMSIDLIKVAKQVIVAERGRRIAVLPDYMTSRVIAAGGGRNLDKSSLQEALIIWFVFGGNLVVTTAALSSAFVGTPLPIELEVSDVVVEEAVAEYMGMLEKARREGRYVTFTREIRYWLFKTLWDYVSSLEEKGVARTSSILFSRSGLQATGFATVDVYSFILKQLEKG